ncbi:MAG TPA: hypothetical protein VMU01_01440, partial [Rhizomicrobium sp.]|nr:hypothetical protein [Rhizomicrobium sp.]
HALTAKDAITLYYWKKGSSNVVRLLHAEAIDNARQISADRYLVTFYKGNDLVAATYTLPEMKLVAEKVLPAEPK